MNTHELTCKYCGDTFTVRCAPDELQFYARCCKPCWEDDRPGMARFERMADMMGERWAIDHIVPVEAGRCC